MALRPISVCWDILEPSVHSCRFPPATTELNPSSYLLIHPTMDQTLAAL